jgi:hypothetical protein
MWSSLLNIFPIDSRSTPRPVQNLHQGLVLRPSCVPKKKNLHNSKRSEWKMILPSQKRVSVLECSQPKCIKPKMSRFK